MSIITRNEYDMIKDIATNVRNPLLHGDNINIDKSKLLEAHSFVSGFIKKYDEISKT